MKKRNLIILSLLVLTTSCEFDDSTSLPISNTGGSSTPIISIVPPESSTAPSTTVILPDTSVTTPSTTVVPPTTSVTPPSTSVVTPSSTTPKPSDDQEPDENNLIISELAGNYYTSIDFSNSPSKVKTDLSKLISGHKTVSYSGLWDAYMKTDMKPGTNYIWDMYSDYNYTKSKQCGNYSVEGDCYNREHSVPKSWFGDKSPMNSDLFHVYPTDGKVNGMRSNYAYGEVKSPTYTSKNGSKLGSPVSFGSGTPTKVFEPIDEYKGDFARTYFYFATRYEGTAMTSGEGGKVFTTNAVFPGLTQYSINLFLKWDEEDPISEKEINRNQIVFEDYQKNRNPFIDIVGLPQLLWGSLRS